MSDRNLGVSWRCRTDGTQLNSHSCWWVERRVPEGEITGSGEPTLTRARLCCSRSYSTHSCLSSCSLLSKPFLSANSAPRSSPVVWSDTIEAHVQTIPKQYGRMLAQPQTQQLPGAQWKSGRKCQPMPTKCQRPKCWIESTLQYWTWLKM